MKSIHIPPPPSPRGEGHTSAAAKTAWWTARPALALAGGEPFALPRPRGCAGTPFPGLGGAIPLTTGRKASVMPLLEGWLPVVTSHPYLQS